MYTMLITLYKLLDISLSMYNYLDYTHTRIKRMKRMIINTYLDFPLLCYQEKNVRREKKQQ